MPKLSEIEENLIRLVGLQLRDFRGFSFMELQLEEEKPVNVFIADNGGGKTTILDSIAGFLFDFLNQTILNQKKILPQKNQKTWNSKDIRNGQEVAYCNAKLKVTYLQPAIELLDIIVEMTDFLNEYDLEGQVAWLEVNKFESDAEDDSWYLILDEAVKGNEDDSKNPIPLPDNIFSALDQLAGPDKSKNNIWEDEKESRKLRPDDTFIVARKTEKGWTCNTCFDEYGQRVSKVKYSGLLELEFEINRAGTPTNARPVTSKDEDLKLHITKLRNGIAFLEDFRFSVQSYSPKNASTTLPLLVYYGGSAINTQFGEVGIRYTAEPYQAYKNALQPGRFDFEDFFEWLNWIKSSEPEHIFDRVQQTILAALNADEETYEELKIEKGQLWLDKVYEKGQAPLPVEVSQLSAGEKNLMALVGDLTKRAIQLNPVLFEIDFDEEHGTFSDPLEYTQGIVLIDEVDLHFHPKWQRQVLPTLRKLFPKIQFLVTTHSPFVIQEVDGSIYRLENGIPVKGGLFGGWSVWEILVEKMGVSDSYGREYEKLVEQFFDEIEKNSIEKAEGLFSKIIPHLPDNSPFKIRLENRLEMLKNEDWI